MKGNKSLYERLTTTESYGSQILRLLKKLGFGILVFIVLMAIIVGVTQLGWNLGWNHNSIFLAAIRGAMFGAIGGSYWAAKEVFNRK